MVDRGDRRDADRDADDGKHEPQRMPPRGPGDERAENLEERLHSIRLTRRRAGTNEPAADRILIGHVFPFERILIGHWALQALRLAFVAFLFFALWIVGRFVGRAFRLSLADAVSERIVEIALGFAVFSVAVRALGFVGLASRKGVLALLIVPLLLLLQARRAGSLPPFPRLSLARGWRAGLAVLALLPLPMALAPAVSYDALVYQLRFPEMTLWTGRWAVDPANSPSFFPAASETLYAATLAVDPSGISAQLVHWGFFLLVLACLVVLGRAFGGGIAGECAAVLFASIPAAGIVAGWSWSDMPLCFALLASAVALGGGAVTPAAALLGLAAACKYSGLALALPLGAACVIAAVRRGRLAALAGGGAAAVLIAAPWYAFDWAATGNPVYPLLAGIFGGSPETGSRIVNWSASPEGASWASYVFRPGTLDSDVGGVGMLVAFGAAAWALRSRRPALAALAVVLGGFAVLAPFAPAARILLPPLAGVCLLAGLAAFRPQGEGEQEEGAGLRLDLPTAMRVLIVVLAARGAALVAAHNALFFNPLPAAVGVEEADEYRSRIFPPDALYRGPARELPEDARVLVFGESRLFRFPRPTRASARVDPPAVLPFVRGAGGPPEVLARVSRAGFTHLLVSLDALRGAPDERRLAARPHGAGARDADGSGAAVPAGRESGSAGSPRAAGREVEIACAGTRVFGDCFQPATSPDVSSVLSAGLAHDPSRPGSRSSDPRSCRRLRVRREHERDAALAPDLVEQREDLLAVSACRGCPSARRRGAGARPSRARARSRRAASRRRRARRDAPPPGGARPTRSSSSRARPRASLAAVESRGSSTFSTTVEVGEQVEELEDDADVPPAVERQLASREASRARGRRPTRSPTSGGRSRRAGGAAWTCRRRTGRATREELARRDVEVDAVERDDGSRARRRPCAAPGSEPGTARRTPCGRPRQAMEARSRARSAAARERRSGHGARGYRIDVAATPVSTSCGQPAALPRAARPDVPAAAARRRPDAPRARRALPRRRPRIPLVARQPAAAPRSSTRRSSASSSRRAPTCGPTPLFLFGGVLVWAFVSAALLDAAETFRANGPLLRKTTVAPGGLSRRRRRARGSSHLVLGLPVLAAAIAVAAVATERRAGRRGARSFPSCCSSSRRPSSGSRSRSPRSRSTSATCATSSATS